MASVNKAKKANNVIYIMKKITVLSRTPGKDLRGPDGPKSMLSELLVLMM